MKEIQFDVVIAGGGMVGAAAALALARSQVRVALIEPFVPEAVSSDQAVDLRCSAISPPSQRILETLGVWNAVESIRACPYQGMKVWDAESAGELAFSSLDMGLPDLGHIVENRLIQYQLWQALRLSPGVKLITDSPLASRKIKEDRVEISLESGVSLQASLLIGADGKQSKTREHAGIPLRTYDYQQSALVAVIATEKSHQYTAWQRFLSSGPLAFLPLKDGSSSIVWSLDTEQSQAMMALPEEAFNQALSEAFEFQLGACKLLSERAAFPLRMQRAGSFIGSRLALVGDAAHVVHPLAGQGVNLGFLDAAALAETVIEALAKGEDPGDARVLNRYQRWRKSDTLMTQEFMTLLKQLFGTRNPAISLVRGMGMKLVDQTILKGLFANHVAGSSDDHPALARGQACQVLHRMT